MKIESERKMTLNLPTEPPFGAPFIVRGTEVPVYVKDGEKVLAVLHGYGDQATFNLRKPKWWEFWIRQPYWVKV